MRQVKISTHDGKTEIYVDGVPMHKSCTRFKLEQSGGDSAVLTLELLCHDIEIEGDGIEVRPVEKKGRKLQ